MKVLIARIYFDPLEGNPSVGPNTNRALRSRTKGRSTQMTDDGTASGKRMDKCSTREIPLLGAKQQKQKRNQKSTSLQTGEASWAG